MRRLLMFVTAAISVSSVASATDDATAAVWAKMSTTLLSVEKKGNAIDCSEKWEIASKDDEKLTNLRYSAVGWGVDEPAESGATVRLYAELGASGSTAGSFAVEPGSTVESVMESASGRGVTDWTPSRTVSRGLYRLTHAVTAAGGTADGTGTLLAFFSFADCSGLRATLADTRTAVYTGTGSWAASNDCVTAWTPVGKVGVSGTGITVGADDLAETGADKSSFCFFFDRTGTWSFDYSLAAGGSLSVLLNGVTLTNLPYCSDWTSAAVRTELTELCPHTIEFRFSGTSGSARLNHVSFSEDRLVSLGEWSRAGNWVNIIPDDTNSWYVMRYKSEVAPFQYSCTNWTGCTGATAESDVSIETVRLSSDGLGEEATNLWCWAETSESAECKFNGEGAYRWKPRVGVWKAKMRIMSGTTTNFIEEAILDLRRLKGGLVIRLR